MVGLGHALLGAAVVLVLGPPPTAPTAAPALDDADTVFCLSAPQRPRLEDAAVALVLAGAGTHPESVLVPEGEISVLRWSHTHERDFARACAALVGSSRATPAAPAAASGAASEPGALESTVLVLLPVLVGGLLAGATSIVTAGWRDRSTRRLTLASDLQSGVRAFSEAVDGFLRACIEGGDQAAGRAAVSNDRLSLLTTVRLVGMAFPALRSPADLEARLSGGELGEELVTGWKAAAAREAQDRADSVRHNLSRLQELADQTVHVLQRGGWHRPPGRSARPPGTPGGTDVRET